MKFSLLIGRNSANDWGDGFLGIKAKKYIFQDRKRQAEMKKSWMELITSRLTMDQHVVKNTLGKLSGPRELVFSNAKTASFTSNSEGREVRMANWDANTKGPVILKKLSLKTWECCSWRLEKKLTTFERICSGSSIVKPFTVMLSILLKLPLAFAERWKKAVFLSPLR